MKVAGAVNRLLSPFGVTLQRRSGPRRATTETALARVAGLGVAPSTVVDVGAAYGDWSALASRLFPSARFLLVEPLTEFAPFLDARARELRGAAILHEAAGATSGEATIHVHEDLVGTSLHDEPGLQASDRLVSVTTIDAIVDRERASGPFLKVDLFFVHESGDLRRHRQYATADQRRSGDNSLRSLYDRRLGELRR